MITKAYITALLKAAAVDHHVYEQNNFSGDVTDPNWEGWYAEHMLAQMTRDYGTASHNPLQMPVINNRRLRGH